MCLLNGEQSLETNKTEFSTVFCVLFLMCNFSLILFNNYKQTLFFVPYFLVCRLSFLVAYAFGVAKFRMVDGEFCWFSFSFITFFLVLVASTCRC